MTKRHTICKVDDVVAGTLLPVTIGRSPLIVYRLPTGDIKAVSGRCPHQGADFTHACVTGYTSGDDPHDVVLERVGEVLRCPWHGFEFDLVSGCPVVETPAMQLREYRVVIEDDQVVVET